MSAAVCVAPKRDRAGLVFGIHPGTYDTEALVEFLGALHRHLGGDKVTLIWDGLPAHKSRAMRTYLQSQGHWLVVESLPPYGYDLNPVEQVWGNLKATELANLCPDTIEEAELHADAGLRRIGYDNDLCFAFIRHAGLTLQPRTARY